MLKNLIRRVITAMPLEWLKEADWVLDLIDDRLHRISIRWDTSDVVSAINGWIDDDDDPTCQSAYDPDDLLSVLHEALDSHDACYGVNWDTLRDASITFGLQSIEEKEKEGNICL